MTVLVLGDQLTAETTPLSTAESVLMVEAREFAARRPYHPAKLTVLFSAMGQFRDRLRERGLEVTYLEAATFEAALGEYFAANPGDSLVAMRPQGHGAADRLRELVASSGGDLTFVDDERFVTTPAGFDEWADGDGPYRHEQWYRHVRRETGVLVEKGEPVGGEWNFDDRNRETSPEGWTAPPVPSFEPDDVTRSVHEWVTDEFDGHWGDPSLEAVQWPVTAEQADRALDHFVEHRLAEFGPYQDAMLDGEWALAHSLVSSSLNLGLLDPMDAVDRAVAAYETGTAPIESVEGFVRQVLGWREFVRHVYRRSMPDLGRANQLDATRDLPPLYYSRETDMACLAEATEHVWERGYAHHIERLMVLSNFALVYGADPHELNEWFHLGFVDAYHWVTTPSVVGMGSYASDVLSSKPYASSGSYSSECNYVLVRPHAVVRSSER